MKLISTAVLSVAIASTAFADAKSIQGSDTMYGLMSDAILQSGLESDVTYVGGGSGKGEEGLVAGTQGIAAMSRAAKDEAVAKAKAKGIQLVAHKVALDAVDIWVNKKNPIKKIDLNSLRSIFSCKAGNWEDVPGSGKKGPIKVFRRNDSSGTTDTFKTLAKIDTFGSCVTVVEETADIAAITSRDENALAYSGLSAGTDKNKSLAVAVDGNDSTKAYLSTIDNVRSFKYPLSRYLFVYEARGATELTAGEASLLDKLLDRSFLDPIAQANEFYTLD